MARPARPIAAPHLQDQGQRQALPGINRGGRAGACGSIPRPAASPSRPGCRSGAARRCISGLRPRTGMSGTSAGGSCRFGQQRLVDVTPRQVTAWLAELTAQGATPSAVNRCFRVLRMVMNAAVRWGAAGQFTDARGPAPAGCTEGDAVPVRPGGALVGGGDPPVVRHMGVLRRLHGAAVERDAPSAPPRHRRGHRTGAGGTPTHQQRRTAGVRAVASNSRCAPSQGRTGWCS